jgi:tetratricopeptide (TPR) repeat protein
VGVEFQDVEPEFKLQIHHLIEFARWEGENPNASFSKHLAEVSMSQPPARLMESLRPSGAPRASAVPSESPSATAQTYTRRKDGVGREDTSFSSSAIAMPVGDLDADIRSAPAPAPPTAAPTPPAAEVHPREQHSTTTTLDASTADTLPRGSTVPAGVESTALKVGMTHISYKRYPQAVKAFEDMLRRHPGHREAQKWLYLAQARDHASKGKDEEAAKAYQQMLEIDESNREARKFVREFHTQKRLHSLPFGRYFAKKKS